MTDQLDPTATPDAPVGTSRRDMLKRGALVGGSVLWMAPVLQTLTPSAFAVVGSETPRVPQKHVTLTVRSDDTRSGGNKYDLPFIQYANNSDADAPALVGFSLTIGKVTANFDRYLAGSVITPAGTTTTVVTPNTTNGGSRFDLLQLTFSPGLPVGMSGRIQVELDPDSTNSVVDFRKIFFNNPANTPSVATFTFADSSTITITLSDNGEPNGTTYSYSV